MPLEDMGIISAISKDGVITAGSGKIVAICPEFSGAPYFPYLPIILGSLDIVIIAPTL
jgi:hypothetical protein